MRQYKREPCKGILCDNWYTILLLTTRDTDLREQICKTELLPRRKQADSEFTLTPFELYYFCSGNHTETNKHTLCSNCRVLKLKEYIKLPMCPHRPTY
jgi:hypothetical protein